MYLELAPLYEEGLRDSETMVTQLVMTNGEAWCRELVAQSWRTVLVNAASHYIQYQRYYADRVATRNANGETDAQARKRRAAQQAQDQEAVDKLTSALDLPQGASIFHVWQAQRERYAEEVLTAFIADLSLSVHVPGIGYKERGELTADDCRALRDYYAQRASRAYGTAEMYDKFIRDLETSGVATLAELSVVAVADAA